MTFPGLVAYMNKHHLADRLLADEPIGRLHSTDDKVVVSAAVARELRRDMTWALAVNVAERVESLFIPLSDVTRYLALVPRFKSLVEIDFLMDRTFRPPVYYGATIVLKPEPDAVLKRQQENRVRHLEEMLLFVKEHRQVHRNKLQFAECRQVLGIAGECPDECKSRLLRLLPPLRNPRLIDANSWPKFVAHLQDTNLEFVESISVQRCSNETLKLDQVIEKGPFLHRCRALESISMPSMGEDDYEWAVKERRVYDSQSVAGAGAEGTTGGPVLLDKRVSLVPLRKVNIYSKTVSSGLPVNDILFAFHDTLEALVVHFNPRLDDHDATTISPSIEIGAFGSLNWSLARLSELRVESGVALLRIHPELLARSPQMTVLLMSDQLGEYQLDEVEYWEPAVSPKLKHFRLKGSPAVSFHPETLRHSSELVQLDLRMVTTSFEEREYCPFIPPIEDLGALDDGSGKEIGTPQGQQPATTHLSLQELGRPVWTWDWDLPKLTNLTLNGEFAYRFQFRMLAGTPGLVYFSVDTNSWTQEHARTIRVEDLLYLLPRSGSCLNEDGDGIGQHIMEQRQQEQQQQEYIHLPMLSNFILSGPWTFDNKIGGQTSTFGLLSTLFQKVIPNVKTLHMVGSRGFSLGDWTASTRDLVHLKSAVVSSHVIATPAAAGDVDGGEDDDPGHGQGSAQAVGAADLFAEAGLQVVPNSFAYQLQYVLMNQPDARKGVTDTPALYTFK
ncbi:hypothetical protein BGW39_008026 [Mortierella sp. 14UC]|nr:hypothetical protein BGW39_008026 [Mortierella sp. 14UC]